MDTWLLLRDDEVAGERNRVLYVLKSRGMAHSNQVREFRLTDRGVALLEPYIGPGGVLTGSARVVQEARDSMEETARRGNIEAREREIQRKRAALQTQVVALQADLASDEAELERLRAGEALRRRVAVDARRVLENNRGATEREGT